jgi:uncharacterized delta-60 repeat protein
MWPFSPRKPGRPPRRASYPSRRPHLEALEDRCLLSAGALDPTFGAGAGYVTTSLSRGSDVAWAVLIQPWDGKIVAAGTTSSGMALTRYNTDGTLDGTFGRGGIEASKIPSNSNKQVAALYPSTDTTGNAKKIVEAGAGSLARFNANGSVDSSFGNKGLVAVSSISNIFGVVVQTDGKIVVAGDDKLIRYNATGTLDTTFGSGGTATVPSIAGGGFLTALGLQPDGKLMAAGITGSNTWELARFTSTGTLDTTFDSTGPVPGTVTFSFAAGLPGSGPTLAIYPSTGPDTADYGKIEVAGSIFGNPNGANSSQIALARFNADGSADSTFGQGGQVVTPFPNSGANATGTTLQADGKIVVSGRIYHPELGHYLVGVLRYDTDGSLDPTFGSGGIVQTANGTSDSWGLAVAIQTDGRIVVAGRTSTSTGWDFMVARYQSAPQIGSFTASPNPVTAGSNVTLTASNVISGGGTVTQVAFYADTNGDGILGTGDILLGYGAQSNGVWTFSFSTAGWSGGSYTLFTQAENSYGTFGDPLALTLTVQ